MGLRNSRTTGSSPGHCPREEREVRAGPTEVPILLTNYACNGEHPTVTYANMQKINLHTRESLSCIPKKISISETNCFKSYLIKLFPRDFAVSCLSHVRFYYSV